MPDSPHVYPYSAISLPLVHSYINFHHGAKYATQYLYPYTAISLPLVHMLFNHLNSKCYGFLKICVHLFNTICIYKMCNNGISTVKHFSFVWTLFLHKFTRVRRCKNLILSPIISFILARTRMSKTDWIKPVTCKRSITL